MSSRAYYDKYWLRSNKFHAPHKELKRVLDRMVELVLVWYDPNGRTLDCGCGRGRLMKKLSGSVYGIDVSKEAIKRCKRDGLNVRQVDLEEKLPFKNNMFSTVVCLEVMEHLREIDVLLSEVRGLLRSDGKFLVSVPYHGLLKNLATVFLNFDQHFNNGDHVRFFTIKSMKNLLRKHGFAVKHIYYIGRIPPLAYSMFLVCEKK